MDLKEQIKAAIETANLNLQTDRKAREDALEKFRQREEEEAKPVKLLIAQYLDEKLVDIDGCCVNIGDILAHKSGPTYKVVNRGMQFVFGEPMFNPSVTVLTYHVLSLSTIGKRPKELHPSELKDYMVVSSPKVKETLEDYRFSTTEPLPTNTDVMTEFLNDSKHFYSVFDREAEIIVEQGTYAEVENKDGKKYAVHAGGDGDFLNHRIRFELLS